MNPALCRGLIAREREGEREGGREGTVVLGYVSDDDNTADL